MKCFVAMAFGPTDVNQIFDNIICRVLEDRQVQPVRVDRVEHNDNIDDRIMQEIRAADFAIADLTYSRPSVYYEAGYSEREIPVIYTVREDHFRPQPDDEHGIFRVHFDLQMKNVVGWRDASDEKFALNLAKRVDLIMKTCGKVQIVSPQPLQEMRDTKELSPGLCYRVAGTLAHLPKDHEIWLLMQNPMTRRIWPQGFAKVMYWSELGEWEGYVHPRSRHLQLTIAAVVAPPSAQMIFSYYQDNGLKTDWNPLPDIPEECTNRATVTAIVP